MEVVLDGRLMGSREETHDLLAEKLGLPEYYGRNLDALYDLLAEYREKVDITLLHADVMLVSMGNYGNALIKTLVDASRAFPNVDFSVSNEII